MGTSYKRSSVSIGKTIRNAIVFNFKHWRGTTMHADNLLQTVERLFSVLEARQIDYVLVGGIALLQYIEGRNTEDIDLIVAVSDLKKLPEVQITSQDADFGRGSFDQLQIDFLLTSNPLFHKVQQQYAANQPFAERTIRCATVEGLLLLKLYALPSLYRQGDFTRVGLYENDIATLLYGYKPAIDPIVTELVAYLSPSDLDAVRDIVAEIEQRIARFRQGQQP